MEGINNTNTVLTAKDLAERLHIGRDRAYALIKSSSFPSIQIGARYIVTENALEQWLVTNQYRHVKV